MSRNRFKFSILESAMMSIPPATIALAIFGWPQNTLVTPATRIPLRLHILTKVSVLCLILSSDISSLGYDASTSLR
jgi:hypothetical protein